jgi:hypothetical protein
MSKPNPLSQLLKFAGFILLFLVFNSCYKNRQGCLEILASNYSIGADEACNGCCTFPKMVVNVTHVFGVEDFILGKEYINNIGSRFIISEQQFYIGDLEFYDANNNKIIIRDSVSLTANARLINQAQDFTSVIATVASSQASSMKYSGKISKVGFILGLNDRLNTIDSLSSLKLSSLNRSRDNYINGKYQSLYMKLKKVSIDKDMTIATPIDYPFVFTLANKEVKAGFPITLDLKVNYATLFTDISFPTMNDVEINARVIANIQKAITLN